MVSDPVGAGQGAPPEHRDGGARPEVTDRALALPEDGGAPSRRSA